MFITKAARRYATALLEVAKDIGQVDAILEDVKFIDATIEGSKELQMFLKSPIVKYDDKMQALDEIFGGRLQQDTTARFIRLLAKKERVNLLLQISKAFFEKYNQYAGIIEVDVYTAKELTDKQKSALHKALEDKTSKKVEMSVNLDASLKGGIAVRIDDTVIDGTVKHKLQELEDQFMNTAIE